MGKTLLGVKPKTQQQLVSYLEKRDFDTNNLYSIGFEYFSEVHQSVGGLPAMRIFNDKGDYIPYLAENETSCSTKPVNFIQKLKNEETYRTVDSLSLKEEFQKLRTLGGEEISFNQLPKADFYILAYWSTYVKTLNKMYVKEWEKQVKLNDKVTIHFIKVNCDIQTWWTPEQLEKAGFNGKKSDKYR